MKLSDDDIQQIIGCLRCEHLHHKKSERHDFFVPCPVVKRLIRTLTGYESAKLDPWVELGAILEKAGATLKFRPRPVSKRRVKR